MRISEANNYFEFASIVCKEASVLFHSNNSKFLFVYNPLSSARKEDDFEKAEKNMEFDGALLVYTSESSG